MHKESYYMRSKGRYDYTNWLAMAMAAAGVRGPAVAKVLFVSNSYAYKIIAGSVPITYQQIIALCDLLGADPAVWAQHSNYVASIVSVGSALTQ